LKRKHYPDLGARLGSSSYKPRTSDISVKSPCTLGSLLANKKKSVKTSFKRFLKK
jgi:hypothetical protein